MDLSTKHAAIVSLNMYTSPASFCGLSDADSAPRPRILKPGSELIGEQSDDDVVGACRPAGRSLTVDEALRSDGGSFDVVTGARRRSTPMRDRQSVVSIPAWLGRQNAHGYARRRRRHVSRRPSAQLLQQRGRQEDERDESDDSEDSPLSAVGFSGCSLPASITSSKLEFARDSEVESTVANGRGIETHHSHTATALHRQNVRAFTAVCVACD